MELESAGAAVGPGLSVALHPGDPTRPETVGQVGAASCDSVTVPGPGPAPAVTTTSRTATAW